MIVCRLQVERLHTLARGMDTFPVQNYPLSVTTRQLGDTLTRLSEASLSASSLVWRIFQQFEIYVLGRPTPESPIQPDVLTLFIAYLADISYSAATSLTYISALGYLHRLASFPNPTKSDLIKGTLKGYKN